MRNKWSSRNILVSVLMASFKRIFPSSLLDGNRGSFQGTKQPACEANCLPPTRSQVRIEWHCTTVPPHVPSWRGQAQIYLLYSHFLVLYSLRWYDGQIQTRDSKIPAADVFRKTACSLSSKLLFRTVKFLTDCRIRLLCGRYVGAPT